jgi:hypothetical protein
MRYSLLLPAGLLAGALALGCDDSPRLTAPADPPAPSFRAERFIFVNAFALGGDPSNPLVLQAGYDAGAFAADICADPFGHGLNGLGRIVITPSRRFALHTSGRDVNLVVYQFGAGPVTDICQLVGAPVVGTGTGKFTFNASDGARGALVTHVTAHGTIDLVSGGQARVWATARVTFRPDGTLLFDEEQVRLTPL